jgi:YbbR domain-containing protein
MAYHPFRHLGLKFLSIALAVFIWLLVADQRAVERSVRAPLEFHNVPEGLELVDDPPETVEVRVRGTSAVLARLLPSEVVGVLNLSAARPGTRLFHLLTDEVRVPYGVQVAQVTPATVGLTFERSGSRIVPVVPAVEGDPAPGYVAGRIRSDPAVVEVVGPVSLLGDLKAATTEPVSIDRAVRPVSDTVTVGVANDNLRLRQPITATVTVEIAPVRAEREMTDVPVRTANVPEGRSATVAPTSVRLVIRGPKDRVDALADGALEPHVDLTGLQPGRMTLPVKVTAAAPDIEVVRIEPESVRVTIK